ncbi:hypothetical protein JYT82_00210 [bacterium AH-315-K20]|nr:hypothetical protein [bacterium AH-315-K20]
MILPSPVDLLRVLGSAIRPDGTAQLRDAGAAEAFENLLEKAQAGSLETGLPVSIASGVDVELSEPQLAELSRLVDRAHAAGATRMAVLVDGKALDVDVLSRRVLGELDLADGRVMTGIDGVVRLDTNAVSQLGVLPAPSPGAMDASLLKLLGQDTHNTARA